MAMGSKPSLCAGSFCLHQREKEFLAKVDGTNAPSEDTSLQANAAYAAGVQPSSKKVDILYSVGRPPIFMALIPPVALGWTSASGFTVLEVGRTVVR